jgi:hypothetical protein
MEFENSPIRVGICGAYGHFENSPLYFMFKKMQITVLKNIRDNPDIIIVWDPYNKIKKNKKKRALLDQYGKGKKKVNFKLKGTGKKTITELFDQMFSQKLSINPLTHSGVCVAKHNDNGTKSCIYMTCPMNAENLFENHVYQKIIDFKHPEDDGILCELRVPIFNGIIPFVFFKERARGLRFTAKNRKVEIANVNDHLTLDEVEEIRNYCKKLGLEYGDLDILRDSKDGKIYIIDVNDTPWWPPNKLFNRERNMALNLFWNSFLKVFLPQIYESYMVPADQVDDYVPNGRTEKFNDEIGVAHVNDPRDFMRGNKSTVSGVSSYQNSSSGNVLGGFGMGRSQLGGHANNRDFNISPEDSVSQVGSQLGNNQNIFNKLKLW